MILLKYINILFFCRFHDFVKMLLALYSIIYCLFILYYLLNILLRIYKYIAVLLIFYDCVNVFCLINHVFKMIFVRFYD